MNTPIGSVAILVALLRRNQEAFSQAERWVFVLPRGEKKKYAKQKRKGEKKDRKLAGRKKMGGIGSVEYIASDSDSTIKTSQSN